MNERETTIVINPAIPLQDITPLERLFLSTVFDAGEIDGALFLHSDRPVSSTIQVPAAELSSAYQASRDVPNSDLNRIVASRWRHQIDESDRIEIGLPETSWEFCRISLLGPRPSGRFGFSNGIATPRRLLTASVPMSC